MPQTHRLDGGRVQSVVIVNGTAEVLGLLDTQIGGRRYDIVFVEHGDHAYSRIREVQPDLVILCTRLDRLDGFDVMTMLRLDPDTRGIPVLAYATELHADEDTADMTLFDGEDTVPARVPLRMN